MNIHTQQKRLALGLCGFVALVFHSHADAQIVPDNTLSTPSTIRTEGNTFVIEGGGSAGDNLFHSFTDFSVPIGNEAFFNNAASVENIIGRVTGSNISNINGALRANGTANLFFLNPNGIAFGPEARLNIGGSFIASSAESLVFADGNTFSTSIDGGSTSLLTVSVPVGLQLGADPGAIRVAGTGHNFSASPPGEIFTNVNPDALQVAPARTLALVGGAIDLEGGILTARTGRVELGAAAATEIGIAPAPTGFALSYAEDANFQPIELSQTSLVEAGGDGGSIQIRGESLRVLSGSLLLLQQEGMQTGGSVNVSVTGEIEVSGFFPFPTFDFQSFILARPVGAANGGSIDLSARSVRIADGALVLNTNAGSGTGGDINVAAMDEVRIVASANSSGRSFLEANAFGAGDAGDVRVETQRLIVKDGGALASDTSGEGAGGRVVVRASESVEVTGVLPNSELRSIVSASSLSSAPAGSIEIYSPRVVVRDGALITSSNFATGTAGSITIDAPESVKISGASPADGTPSQISASTLVSTEFVRELFDLPEVPSGDAGSTIVRTENLVVDGGLLSALNQGQGNAGTIAVEAENIRVKNDGQISADAMTGNAGTITLAVDDRLRLRGLGRISASVEESGNGGTIAIAAEDVAVRQGSTIAADAIDGNGGTIAISAEDLRVSPGQITASAIGFGNGGTIAIAAEDVAIRRGSTIATNAVDGNGGTIAIAAEDLSVSPNSNITATSEFGTDGTVAIIESDGDFAEAFQPISEAFADLPTEVADIVSTLEGNRCDRAPATLDAADERFVEARGWQRDRNGDMLLTAEPLGENCTIAAR